MEQERRIRREMFVGVKREEMRLTHQTTNLPSQKEYLEANGKTFSRMFLECVAEMIAGTMPTPGRMPRPETVMTCACRGCALKVPLGGILFLNLDFYCVRKIKTTDQQPARKLPLSWYRCIRPDLSIVVPFNIVCCKRAESQCTLPWHAINRSEC